MTLPKQRRGNLLIDRRKRNQEENEILHLYPTQRSSPTRSQVHLAKEPRQLKSTASSKTTTPSSQKIDCVGRTQFATICLYMSVFRGERLQWTRRDATGISIQVFQKNSAVGISPDENSPVDRLWGWKPRAVRLLKAHLSCPVSFLLAIFAIRHNSFCHLTDLCTITDKVHFLNFLGNSRTSLETIGFTERGPTSVSTEEKGLLLLYKTKKNLPNVE